jgi:hypothetical protein
MGQQLNPIVSQLSSPRRGTTHLKPLEWRAHIRAHLVPIDDVATMLGVATHGPRARALVVALVDILGGETEAAEF